MERKISEIFEYKDEWYQCLKSDCEDCIGCDLYNLDNCENVIGECTSNERSDNNSVIFKKLEKVGEPITINAKQYQLLNSKYRWCDGCALRSNDGCEFMIKEIEGRKCECGAGGIYVKIKEKNKMNLKPFDLEQVEAGKPVCTRDGRKARIICFDKAKDIYPIIALVTDNNGYETIMQYHANGVCSSTSSFNDLMMLSKRKSGWVNIYYERDARTHRKASQVYDKEEEAVKVGKEHGSQYITTIKIQWEE